jgi:heme-degrading monooxygenase HmoA
MYVSMSRLAVPAERAPEPVAAFKSPARLAGSATGFIDLQLWQSDRDAGEVVMVGRWSDRGVFTAYLKSADHKASHRRIDPGRKADITMRELEHTPTYEMVAE